MDGHAIPKDARTTAGVPLSRILNAVPKTMTRFLPRPKVAKGTNNKKKVTERKNVKADIKYHVLKYDITTELSNTLSGLIFCIIFRGDAMDAKK